VPDNTKPLFDYGIFLDSLEIGNTRHIHFPTKLCYCFWWGLRNLSNFGTNLATSNYAWENFFAILTSITGLLLFVYLIGNVQIFIQMETTKSEKLKRKNFFNQIKQKIELKGPAIEAWMAKNGIPDDMKKEIMENINQKLKEDKDADLENLF
ncbi:cyclic nucleotide gated channel 1, partial [Prunus dulcis]